MTIRAQFRRAERFLAVCTSGERRELEAICGQIRTAEDRLQSAADPLMDLCSSGCRGICCRNVDLDAIIGLADMVYVLVRIPELRARMRECLQRETALFSQDCVFLENGLGPCIFTPDQRPEVCITTFCGDDAPVRSQIRRVKRRFRRLSRFMIRCRFRRLFRSGRNVVSPRAVRRRPG